MTPADEDDHEFWENLGKIVEVAIVALVAAFALGWWLLGDGK